MCRACGFGLQHSPENERAHPDKCACRSGIAVLCSFYAQFFFFLGGGVTRVQSDLMGGECEMSEKLLTGKAS